MPQNAWSSPALWFLRAAFAIRCFGLGCKYLWREFEIESSLFGVMFFEWGWDESKALRLDDVAVYLLLGVGCIVLAAGFVRMGMVRLIELAGLLYATVYETLLALAARQRGGELMSEWAVAEHGLRIGVPLALLVYGVSRWRMNQGGRTQEESESVGDSIGARVGEWVLRLATSATFAAHGLKAWFAAPVFVTMVLSTWQRFFGGALDQSQVEVGLKVIAIADLIVAAGILGLRWPMIAFYAAIWGGITACGRTTANLGHWHETLIRAVHFGGPWLLFLHWRRFRTRDVEEPSERMRNR